MNEARPVSEVSEVTFLALQPLPPNRSPAPLAAVESEIRTAGALVSMGPSCVQLAPALVYNREDIERLSHALRTGLDRAAEALAAPLPR